jgi:hypothetical protein
MGLKAQTVRVNELTEKHRKEMFELFSRYYENIKEDKFYDDLDSKDRVIVLTDSEEGKIRGFSTLLDIKTTIDGERIYGLFSGDTVIDCNFWGGTALTMEFFKNVMLAKAKHPTHEVYWFLISKGYKTYLLLANNFKTYYPRFDKQTPSKHNEIIENFATQLFGSEMYDKETLILKCANKFDRLKDTVAPISNELALKNPKIAYFEKMNPNWQEGDELCCIGRIDMGLAIKYLGRTFKKRIKKVSFVPTSARI